MKKKLIGFIACFSFILAFGLCMFGGYGQVSPTVCHAASITAEVETIDTIEETSTTDNSNEKSEENPTFFGRLWEFVETNYPEIAATVGNVITIIMLIVYHVKSKKKLLNIDTATSKQLGTQSEVVDAVNCLIEGYNSLETELSDYNKTEDERYKAVGAMVVQTKAILEILVTVYANSKNIPQGVKDLINLKYAKSLTTIEDNEQLKEIAQSGGEEVATEVKESETEEV